MPAIDALLPALLIAFLMLLGALYYRAVRRVPTQQEIRFEPDRPALRFTSAAPATLPNGFFPLGPGESGGPGSPAADVEPATILGRDRTIDGYSRFVGPLKAEADLVVTDRGVFEAPVVVAGTARVEGVAWFAAGLLAKDKVVVGRNGRLVIGTADRPAWLITSRLIVAGEVHFNGQISISDRDRGLGRVP